jgi:hypothetical protein
MPEIEPPSRGQETLMGLDLMELVLAVEDAFGFSIPDEDVAKLDTMGKLYEDILAHRFQSENQGCLTSIVFYRLRRAMMAVLDVPRKNVRVATRLSVIIPRHRRRAWHAIQKAARLRLPPLRRPDWVNAVLVTAVLVLAIATPLLLGRTLLNGAIVVGILAAVGGGYLLSWLTIPLAFAFQPFCHTVGELTLASLARNFQALHQEAGASNAAEVWDMLCRCVAKEFGIEAGGLTKETNFLKDL